MNDKLKNFLFLAMQKGGSMTPQMNQQAMQSGMLPKMQMGNDITKMHMRQASHYGFQKGGEQQEEIDQYNLSPVRKYNQRVSNFLDNLKEQAMSAVQDEMLSTNEAYAEEASDLDGMMPMAQYGMQYNQSGIDAAKAWEAAAKKRTNVVEPLIGAASMATGLKGYWGDTTAFGANPYNTQYIKKVKYKDVKGTEPVIPVEQPSQLSTTQTFQPGGQYDAWRSGLGSPSSFVPGGRNADVYGQAAADWMNNNYSNNADTPKTDWGSVFMQGVIPQQQQGPTFVPGTGQSFMLPENRQQGTGTQAAPPPQPKPKADTKKGNSTNTNTGTTSSTTTTPPAGTQVVTNADGTQSSISAEEAAKRKEEADKAAKEKQETKTETKTETTTDKEAKTEKDAKKVGDGYDYLRAIADPNSMQAGAVYTTDKKGNQVPLAFYDPNMRVISTTADYRNTAGNIFRRPENKKAGAMKSFTVRYGTLADGTPVAMDQNGNVIDQAPITQSANVNDTTGAKEVTGLKPNPDFDLTWSTGKQMPTPSYAPGTAPITVKPGTTTSMGDLVPGAITVGPQGGGSSVVPTIVPQNAPITPEQQAKIDKINARTQRRVGNINQDTQQEQGQNLSLDQRVANLPTSGYTKFGAGYPNVQQRLAYLLSSGQTDAVDKELSKLGYKKGGELRKFIRKYDKGGPGTTSATDWQNMFKTAFDESDMQLADQGPIDPDTGLPIESSLDKPITDAERMKVFDDAYNAPGAIPGPGKKDNRFFKNIKEAKYKLGKDNPFLAPAMMAGLDTLAGVAQNRDAAQKEGELRNRLAFDQIGFKVPQTSGSQGDWTVNEGYIRPNDMVPVQFQGAGPIAAMGGSFNEGDELYLDDDTINAILAMGGEIEYLD